MWVGVGVWIRFPAGRRLLQRGGGHPHGWAGLCCHPESLPPAATVKGVSGWRARRAGGSAAACGGGTWADPTAAAAPNLRLRPSDQPCLSVEPLSAASRPQRLKLPYPAGEQASGGGFRHCSSPSWLRGSTPGGEASGAGKSRIKTAGSPRWVWRGGFLEQPNPQRTAHLAAGSRDGSLDPAGSGPPEDEVLGLTLFPGLLETVWAHRRPVRRDTVEGLRFPVLSSVLPTRTPAGCSNGRGRCRLIPVPLPVPQLRAVEAVGFRRTYPLSVCLSLSLGTCWTSTPSPSPTPVGGTRAG